MVFQFSFVSSNRMVESLIVENNKISDKFMNPDLLQNSKNIFSPLIFFVHKSSLQFPWMITA